MVRLLTFIAIVVSLAACGTSKSRVAKHINTTVKDSTVTEVRYQKRDTLITIPGDTLKFKIPVTEITREGQTFTQGRQTVKISSDELGNISIECINAAMDRIIELEDKIISTLRTIESNTKETIIVPEPYTPWYTKALAWIGGVMLLLMGIGFITKTIKR
jgi:hypothetical protein